MLANSWLRIDQLQSSATIEMAMTAVCDGDSPATAPPLLRSWARVEFLLELNGHNERTASLNGTA